MSWSVTASKPKGPMASTLPAIAQTYAYWTRPPHLIPDLGLSRYHGLGKGPAPEVVHGERDAQGRSHYDRVRQYYATVPVTRYDVSRFYDADTDTLTSILTYHVLAGEVDAATAISLDGQSAATLNGAEIAVSVVDGNVMINDATVIIPDVAASNGIIHVIDFVLLP